MAVLQEAHSIGTINLRTVEARVLYAEKTSVDDEQRSTCTILRTILGLGIL
jgi:hypothetical protein